jgi:hypothetical protein
VGALHPCNLVLSDPVIDLKYVGDGRDALAENVNILGYQMQLVVPQVVG